MNLSQVNKTMIGVCIGVLLLTAIQRMQKWVAKRLEPRVVYMVAENSETQALAKPIHKEFENDNIFKNLYREPISAKPNTIPGLTILKIEDNYYWQVPGYTDIFPHKTAEAAIENWKARDAVNQQIQSRRQNIILQ